MGKQIKAYSHHEILLNIKMNNMLIYMASQTNLKNSALSEESQTRKTMPSMIPFE